MAVNKNNNDMPNIKPPVSCIPQEMVIKNVRLAAAYVPYQKMCTLFSPIEGLKKGTIFPELYSPYDGKEKGKKCKGDEK